MFSRRRTPWAGVADVEVISVFLGRELRSWSFGDGIAELGRLAIEIPCFLVCPVGDLSWLEEWISQL